MKMKKGTASWQPAAVTDVVNKEPGYRYRWSAKDADTLAKRKAEHWETVSGLQSDQVSPTEHNRQDEGQGLTSIYEKRDLILQRIPEEIALERDAFFNDKADRQVSGLTAHTKAEMSKEGAGMHGEITISSRKRTQVI